MAWKRVEGSSNPEEERGRQGPSDGLIFLIAVIVIGVLVMVAIWLLDAYSIPNDDSIYLGLLGFLFVLVLFPLVVPKFVQSRGRAAVKLTLILVLLGLIAFGTVYSLPFLWRRLIVAAPWVQEIPWGFLLVLWLAAHDFWISRKSTENDHRYSWKGSIFLGSLLILLITSALFEAVSRFSAGKAWLGALYLAIAVLLGLFHVNIFVETWRIWRKSRSANQAAPADQKASLPGR